MNLKLNEQQMNLVLDLVMSLWSDPRTDETTKVICQHIMDAIEKAVKEL